MKPRIHLVSFADGSFTRRAEGFSLEAHATGFFDSVTVFNMNLLDEDYIKQHKGFMLSNNRGFGYWIWKPQVVLQTARLYSSNDIIVYMDVGFELNKAGKQRFFDYIDLTLSHESKMLSFSNTHTEYRWNKRDLPQRLDISLNSPFLKTTQLAAGFFLMQNTAENVHLIEMWRDIAVEDNYHYSDDSPSKIDEHPCFVEHRHDASIFSLLRKTRGTEVTHYEVQTYPHFAGLKEQLPAWASRKGRE
ncbi:hypothetical protein [Alteromonas antoniana]|uniref:hypothetical protein n=1 Tax=Alteromonas antoniana TaxID=2803813 RepID=UPI001C47C1C3|nr:hypothetical protein [Alteromonas antoniana]